MTDKDTNSNPHAKVTLRRTLLSGWRRVDEVTLQPRSLRHGGWADSMSREVMINPGAFASAILYIPETDEIVLSEQFRIGAFVAGADDPFLFECVAGMIDPGETPEDAAVRETLEETGCTVRELEFIGSFYTSPGCINEEGFLFCARVAPVASGGIFGVEEEGEEIKTHLLPAGTVIKMLDEGHIRNAPSALALHWFARNKERIRKKWVSTP